jgi:hypothetical protein
MSSPEVELLAVSVTAALSPTTLMVSVFSLVLGDRPLRTGLWFFLGAFGATLVVGIVAGLVLGDVAHSPNPSQPKTWVAILDVALGVIALLYAVRLWRKPIDPENPPGIGQMSKLASSPAIAIVGAGAALANPGGFIPVALKDISELNPSPTGFILDWVLFALISLLPLLIALLLLLVAREWALRMLKAVHGWLLRNAFKVGAGLLTLLGVVLVRDGLAGLLA